MCNVFLHLCNVFVYLCICVSVLKIFCRRSASNIQVWRGPDIGNYGDAADDDDDHHHEGDNDDDDDEGGDNDDDDDVT